MKTRKATVYVDILSTYAIEVEVPVDANAQHSDEWVAQEMAESKGVGGIQREGQWIEGPAINDTVFERWED